MCTNLCTGHQLRHNLTPEAPAHELSSEADDTAAGGLPGSEGKDDQVQENKGERAEGRPRWDPPDGSGQDSAPARGMAQVQPLSRDVEKRSSGMKNGE